jgi:uncharacterized membrane protein YccC
MARIGKRHGAGIAILAVGIAFLIIGGARRSQGGSSAFIVIGFAFMLIGIRRIRRARPDSAL